jgi:hypothetical protein
MHQTVLFFILFLTISCEANNYDTPDRVSGVEFPQPGAIREIDMPDGFQRTELPESSFGEWLRGIRLKKDNHVYLYNGTMKQNQSLHFAVLDVSVGNKDLQQCADAVMRLRAEFLFEQKRFDEIIFIDNTGKSHAWTGRDNNIGFTKYLETVFSYCNSASLEKQLRPVKDWKQLQPGDIFIKGGFPGHAMIVVDIATDVSGRKIFLLAQSFMPAQSIHIVINPIKEKLSPWYEVDDAGLIVTPGWTFYKHQLYRF